MKVRSGEFWEDGVDPEFPLSHGHTKITATSIQLTENNPKIGRTTSQVYHRKEAIWKRG